MGDTLVEVSMQVQDAWEESPDIQAASCAVSAGGSAANFAAVVAALGIESVLATNIGADFFRQFLLDDLRRSAISSALVREHSGRNSTCVITIGADGERRFLSHRGAQGEGPSADYLHRMLSDLASRDWLHISGFWLQHPVTAEIVVRMALQAASLGIPISLDPSPQIMETPNEFVDQVIDVADVLFPNAYEACTFTQTTEPGVAACQLADRGVPTVIVTDGADGVHWATSEGVSTIEAPVVPAADTTGAGDALAAGFVASRLFGNSIGASLQVGIQTAAVIIGEIGGHTAIDQLTPIKA